MSDYKSSLPVRTEADGADERLQTKIVDATSPDTQQMEVDTDNNAHVEVHGNRADDAADVVLLLSEEGRPNPRGDYEADDNSKPASAAKILHARAAAPTEAEQLFRPTGVQGTADNTVHAADIALHDEDGNAYTANNPLPVAVSESEGEEVVDYDQAVNIAKDASANHDYTVTAAKTLVLDYVWCAASGRTRFELQIEDGVGAGTFTTQAVAFNSTSNPNVKLDIARRIVVAAGIIVRVVKTNLDNQQQDLYTTIYGIEK